MHLYFRGFISCLVYFCLQDLSSILCSGIHNLGLKLGFGYMGNLEINWRLI